MQIVEQQEQLATGSSAGNRALISGGQRIEFGGRPRICAAGVFRGGRARLDRRLPEDQNYVLA